MVIGLDFNPEKLVYPIRHQRKVPFRPMPIPPPAFDETAARIVELDRGLDRFYLAAPDYLKLVQEATAANVHWSTKIEGNPLSESEVGGTTRRALSGEPTPEQIPDGPHQEILNHLVVWLRPEMFDRPWKVSTLQSVHRILLTGVDPGAKPGTLRAAGDEVDVHFEDGGVRFRAAPGTSVQGELESLLEWVNDIAPAYRPIVAATLLFHEFESIHPFLDGNGRLGRVLFHAYLQTNGLRNAHLCIMEPHIVGDRDRYLDLLTWADATNDYAPLIDHIARSILRAYQEAHDKMKGLDLLSTDLNETAKAIMIGARRHKVWFTIKEAAEWIQGTEQTAGLRIRDLCNREVLEATGRTQNRRFRFRNPLRPFLEATQTKVDQAVSGDA
jgi:Fic family protein